VATGITTPWGIAFLPDGQALVGERDTGRVRLVGAGTNRVVGTVPGVLHNGEGGLLGLALSPRYATDHLLYAYLTTATDNRIVRMTYGTTGLGRPDVVLAGIPSGNHHNGGRLAFGPDGMLYATTGETGDTALAQDRSSLGGKILRMTPDGRPAADNPYAGSVVWSYGHRNVEGLAFDARGQLWATEFGASFRDELNHILPGRNYGWPMTEGFTDAAGITLALLAIRFAQRPATSSRTFGYLRLEILAAVVNAVLLLLIAAFVLIEAWQRLSQPPDISPGAMLAFALVGLVANGISLFILREAQATSLNMRGAYLEVMGDLAGSVAVIVAAVVIALTGWWWADVVASVVIGLLILPRTLALLRDATNVLMESTPKGVDMAQVRAHILEAPGVDDVHDLHAWTITSGLNVVSAHVVLDPGADAPAVLDHLCTCLADIFDIEHSTFQLESSDRRRLEEHVHA